MLAGVRFRCGELSRLVVLHVTPGEAIGNHFHVDEAIPEIDSADLTMLTVDVHNVDA